MSNAAVAGHRDELIRFWLAAPDDALESLWDGPAGQVSRELIAQLTPTTYFTPEQQELRRQLGSLLRQGFQQPGAIKALLASFLLMPPGRLRIAQPESHLPGWLLPAYRGLYEQGQMPAAPVPAPPSLSSPVAAPPLQPVAAPAAMPGPPGDLGSLPSSLAEFAADRLQLNRLLGLSNLYYIDPDDAEIRSELRQLRLHLSGLLQRCPEAMLEGLFAADFGERYLALVRSGVQQEPLEPAEAAFKQAATRALQPSQGGGFGRPGAVNAFLVAMLFFEPGSMAVDDAERKLPSWLLPAYQEVFAQPLQAR